MVAWALAREGKTCLRLETDAGRIETRRETDVLFTVDMGAPRLDWRDIPLAHTADTAAVTLDPPVAGAPAQFSAVNMGNPHAVAVVPDPDAFPLATVGPRVETLPSRVGVLESVIVAALLVADACALVTTTV